MATSALQASEIEERRSSAKQWQGATTEAERGERAAAD